MKRQELFRQYQSFARGDVRWVFVLEQYEVLFPETARCRIQLVHRSVRVRDGLLTFFSDMLMDSARREEIITTAEPLRGELSDQSALLKDLLVHLQNATLGDVVGREAPFRQPPDPAVPRIVMRKGHLTIVEGQGNVLETKPWPMT